MNHEIQEEQIKQVLHTYLVARLNYELDDVSEDAQKNFLAGIGISYAFGRLPKTSERDPFEPLKREEEK